MSLIRIKTKRIVSKEAIHSWETINFSSLKEEAGTNHPRVGEGFLSTITYKYSELGRCTKKGAEVICSFFHEKDFILLKAQPVHVVWIVANPSVNKRSEFPPNEVGCCQDM